MKRNFSEICPRCSHLVLSSLLMVSYDYIKHCLFEMKLGVLVPWLSSVHFIVKCFALLSKLCRGITFIQDVHLSQPFQTHPLCTGKITFSGCQSTKQNVGRLHGCAGACDFGQHVISNNKTSHTFHRLYFIRQRMCL